MAVTVDYTEVFPERATRGIEITFKDSDDNAVVPNSANWSLTTAPSYRDQGVNNEWQGWGQHKWA